MMKKKVILLTIGVMISIGLICSACSALGKQEKKTDVSKF